MGAFGMGGPQIPNRFGPQGAPPPSQQDEELKRKMLEDFWKEGPKGAGNTLMAEPGKRLDQGMEQYEQAKQAGSDFWKWLNGGS